MKQPLLPVSAVTSALPGASLQKACKFLVVFCSLHLSVTMLYYLSGADSSIFQYFSINQQQQTPTAIYSTYSTPLTTTIAKELPDCPESSPLLQSAVSSRSVVTGNHENPTQMLNSTQGTSSSATTGGPSDIDDTDLSNQHDASEDNILYSSDFPGKSTKAMENEPGTSQKTASSQGETSTNEAEKSQTSDTIDSTTSTNAMPSSKKRNKKKKHTCDCDIHLTEVKEIIQKVDNKVDFLLQKMEPLLKVSFVIQQDAEQQSQV